MPQECACSIAPAARACTNRYRRWGSGGENYRDEAEHRWRRAGFDKELDSQHDKSDADRMASALPLQPQMRIEKNAATSTTATTYQSTTLVQAR